MHFPMKTLNCPSSTPLSLPLICASLPQGHDPGNGAVPMEPTRHLMNTLLVVADLSGFKAFKLQNNNHIHPKYTARLELFEQFDNPKAHDRLMDRVTDLSG